MLLNLSECLVCTQTANLRLAASPWICYGDQRLRSPNTQLSKQIGGCDDMALEIQARSLDLGPPDLWVWIPSLELWWWYQVLWIQTTGAEYTRTHTHTHAVGVWTIIYRWLMSSTHVVRKLSCDYCISCFRCFPERPLAELREAAIPQPAVGKVGRKGKSSITTLLRTWRAWAGVFWITLCWPLQGLVTALSAISFPKSNRKTSHQYLHKVG